MVFFRKRYHPPGTAPGTLIEHRDIKRYPLHISVIDYTRTTIEEKPGVEVEDCRSYLSRPTITWIHVQGYPGTEVLQALARIFDLHPLALEDVANVGQRPKLEPYEDHFFLALSLPVLGDGLHTDTEQVSLFMGEGYVVSFHPGPFDPFEPVRKRLRKPGSRIRRSGPDYLLYALLDTVIDGGFPMLESIGERIEDLEIELLDHPDQTTLGRIHAIKRELLLLRRMLWPHREVVNLLMRDEGPLIQTETRLYLRDCYDHSVEVMELLETYREMTAGMLDVYLSSTSHRLNEIMQVLTIIATIFIPLTFIVGVYGMNFGRDEPRSPWAMPELDWYYGYPLIWLVMLVLAIGMMGYFKYRRWF